MAGLIRRGLTNEGLAADVVGTGEDALWMAQAHEYDAIVLDVMLPGLNGFETCRRLRKDGVWVPVLMLTARDSVEDRVAGLDTGADDYLVKPFAFAELLARLRALARRGELERPSVLEVGDLRLDPATGGVRRRDGGGARRVGVVSVRPLELASRYRVEARVAGAGAGSCSTGAPAGCIARRRRRRTPGRARRKLRRAARSAGPRARGDIA